MMSRFLTSSEISLNCAEKFTAIDVLTCINEFRDELLNVYSRSDPNIDFSIYTGVAGVICALITCGYKDDALLLVRHHFENAEAVFSSHENQKRKLITGVAGFFIISCVVLKDSEEYDKTLLERAQQYALASLEAFTNSSTIECEFLYGAAGALYCIRLLQANGHPENERLDRLRGVLVNYLIRVRERDGRWLWHGKEYYGAAHGAAGILLMLQRSGQHELRGSRFVKDVFSALLVDARIPASGNFKSSRDSQSDKLVQWCHGAPGMLLLLLEIYNTMQDSGHPQQAELEELRAVIGAAAQVVAERGMLTKWLGLCHGMGGNGLVLLLCCRILKRPYPALFLQQQALHEQEEERDVCAPFVAAVLHHQKLLDRGQLQPADSPFSLFQGIAGAMCFLHAYLHPAVCTFPAFTDY